MSARPDRLALVTAVVLGLGTFVAATDVLVVAGLLRWVAPALDVPVPVAGQLVSVFAVTYAVLGPLSSVLTRRLSRPLVLGAALTTLAAGNLVFAVAGDYPVAAAGRVLAAAGASLYTAQAVVHGVSLFPAALRGRALAIVSGGLSVGGAVGVPVGILLADRVGWRLSVGAIAVAALAVAAALTALHAARPPVTAGGDDRGGGTGSRAGDPAFRAPPPVPTIALVLAVTLLTVTAEYTVYTYISVIFADRGGAGLALLLLLFGIGGPLGPLLGGVLAGRATGRYLVPVAILVIVGVFAALPLLTGSLWAAAAAMVLWGIAGWTYLVPQQQRLLALAGGAGSFVVSLNHSALYSGTALGAALGGTVLGLLGQSWLAPIAAGVGVLALVAHLCASRTRPAPVAREEVGP